MKMHEQGHNHIVSSNPAAGLRRPCRPQAESPNGRVPTGAWLCSGDLFFGGKEDTR